MNLSILCVTKGEAYTSYFLGHLEGAARALDAECVIVADGHEALARLERLSASVREAPTRVVHSLGYIESVLDAAVDFCTRDWILRIDDDEVMSPAMLRWLGTMMDDFNDTEADGIRERIWKFPRFNLYGVPNQYLTNAPLWPDHQTRLTTKAMAKGRTTIHAGCPHGGGALAPGGLEHHGFLIRSLAERKAKNERYERLQTGAGSPMMIFSCPELVLTQTEMKFAELGEAWR